MPTRLILTMAVLAACLCAQAAAAQTADQIIAASDKVRNPGVPFRVTNALTEYHGGKPADRIVLEIFAKQDRSSGQFRNIARYAEPPRDSGKLIQKVGSVLWFYDPASKASVRLSAQQRLIGQASNGDAITVNLALDYTGTIAGKETIQDADRKNRACWHLNLTPTTASATYGRVEYWIEEGTYFPIKGKLYSDSGRLLKIVYYRKFERELGGVRPTEAIFIDALDSNLVTLMSFRDYRQQDIPEAWFQREYLPRIGSE
ncbi:MAG TPA: outer membrane lipoprotein-sorting protein [bacterium]|nr:outer membrane lipoprotein-sorting protein [bacterium]